MSDATTTLAGDPHAEIERQLEQHRVELTGYCYRMLGSGFEAEDAVQDTLVRAWRSYDRFEGRSSLRSWLYRIATNVCLDLLDGRKRRASPMDLGPAGTPTAANLGAPLAETTWVQPIPDGKVLPANADPADLAVERESIRLAFIAALQHLPPRQRAVLILREVLRWKAEEVAELLGTTVASVNSALQRARATLASSDLSADDAAGPMDDEQTVLLEKYVDAFERYDLDSLVTVIHEDASWSMPPYALWLRGHDHIKTWMLGPGAACRDSRLVATHSNGAPAFGQYKPEPGGGRHAWALQVLDIQAGVIQGIVFYLDVEIFFPMFGLPLDL